MVKEKDEVIYTINLNRAYWGKRVQRARRAIKIIRQFIARHMGVEPENVKIDNTVNHYIWSRSIEKPPRRVQVFVKKLEDGVVWVSLAKTEPVEG